MRRYDSSMATLYDEEGNPVEGVMSKDEAEALRKDAEEAKAERDRLKDKDMNFQKLRQKLVDKGISVDDDDKKDEKPKEDEKKPADKPEEKKEKNNGPVDISSEIEAADSSLSEKERNEAAILYASLTKGIDDPAARKIMLDKAISVAKIGSGSNGFDRSNGAPKPARGERNNDESTTSQQIGESIFGLSAEDKKKYGGADWKPSFLGKK